MSATRILESEERHMFLSKKNKQWVAGITVFVMLCIWFPITPGAAAADNYGKMILNNVALRDAPKSSGVISFRMPLNWIVEITATTGTGTNLWYKVKAPDPDPKADRIKEGYVLGSCMAPLTAEGLTAWVNAGKPKQGDFAAADMPAVLNPTATPPAQTATNAPANEPTNAPTNAAPTNNASPPPFTAGTLAMTNAGGVNMRKTADGALLLRLEARGTTVTVLDVTVKDGKTWYKVQYGSQTGYIMGDFLTLTGVATATATTAVNAAGYVKLILSSANLRKTPEGAKLNEWLPKNGLVMPYLSQPVTRGAYTWYEIYFSDGKTYYVRGDTVTPCDAGGTPLQPGNNTGNNTGSTNEPTSTATIPSGAGILKIKKDDVNFRKTEGGVLLGKLKIGTELIFTAISHKGGYDWYYVTTAAGVKGYVRDDCVMVLSGGQSQATTPPAATGAYGTLRLTMDKVNLRDKPAGQYLEMLPIGAILPVTAPPVTSGAYTWYPVKSAAGRNGYVRADMGIYTGDYAPNATPTSTGSTAATTGYVIILLNSVNLRKTAGGAVIGQVQKNEVYPMTGSVSRSGAYDWYPVQVKGANGYVRGDMLKQLTPAQVDDYLNNRPISSPSATPTSTAQATTRYLMTTLDSVNLRVAANKDSQAKANVKLGTVFSYSTSQVTAGSVWYKIVYDNQPLWVLGTCVKIMTQAEYDAWLASNPAVTPPAADVITGYVKTTVSSLNIRKTAGGAVTGNRVETKGTILSYSGDPVVKSKVLYYYCKTAYGYGYISGSYLEVCDASGKPIATPTPASSGKEASYTVLSLGATGNAVKEMVTELKAQGFFSGTITSTYNSAVVTAVKAFQASRKLTVDGIAGPSTLHALFGTVPVGSSSNPNFTMYPCEKIDWFTGGIQTIWAKGTNAVIKDVATGTVINVYRWSGGNHADVEPLTAADTARICKMYNVKNADQITASTHWHRRPIWVTVGGRTFAASMYGVPHNYPEGDTIKNNDFKGQFCVHFVNSRTHTSNVVDADHQAAINTAYNQAPVKK